MKHVGLQAGALLVAAAASLTAHAATFAVVPLIGRNLTMVGAQPVTSTHLDRNQYQVGAPDGDPMHALTTAEKLGSLQALLRDEIARILPGLLAQTGP
jgi:hypothetical protein